MKHALTLALALTCSSSVRAQNSDALESESRAVDDTAETAALRVSLEAAVSAVEQGEYQLALEKFTEVHTVAPRPTLAFNIGFCLQRLGRVREAAEAYEEALRGGLDEEGRARAEAQLAEARARIAIASVHAPVGWTLTSGERECIVPCRLEVDPGTHVFVVVREAQRHSSRATFGPGEERDVQFAFEVEVSAPEPERGYSPRWATWVGGSLALAGAGGIVGFGLVTDARHEDYQERPSADLAEQGERYQALTNASIGVAAVGGILILIDVLTQL